MSSIVLVLSTFICFNYVHSQVPVIKAYNSEITLKVGDVLKMECPIEVSTDGSDASLQSSIMYEWKIKQFNDVSVAMNSKYSFNHNSRILNITKPLGVEDSGRYVCKGITGFGSKEAVFNIKVIDTLQKRLCAENKINDPKIEAPCFLDPQMRPGEIIVRREVGSYVEFSCEATGTPPLKYLWFSGKTIANWIQTADGIRSPTMSISKLKTTYTGQYTCQVSNQAGSLNYTYRLIVIDSPNNSPRIVTELMNYTFRSGDKASITVEIECECKSPIIKWLKRVEINDNTDKDNLKGLTLPNAKPSEKGELYITLENGVSTRNTQANVFESQLNINPLGKQDSGKYIVMTMNKIVNFKNFEYRAVYINVESDKAYTGIRSNLIVYIAVPMVILLSSLAVIIYCCFRRHSPGYARSTTASRSSHQCGNGGSGLPSFTNGSNTGSEKMKSPSTTSTGAVPVYNQYKYMYPPQAPSSTYDQYSVLSVSHASQTTPQYFQPTITTAGGQFTNPYHQNNGYVPVPISHYPA
uniref:NDK n=1 Tax=Dendrocoelum lacteum TaxID=27895 RepID=T1E1E1_9PLAT